jgi:hypothetical protein
MSGPPIESRWVKEELPRGLVVPQPTKKSDTRSAAKTLSFIVFIKKTARGTCPDG